jgi:hypothetical protein
VLGWAARRGALVIEDDYDAEYRYDRAPVGAMQGLSPNQVVYAGTASKTLAPGLRLGWLVVPPHLTADVAAAKVDADRGSPVLDQLTFADFLDLGEFDRHLRRMRPLYRRRRDALLHALHQRLLRLRPTGISAGLHLVAWLPPELDEARVVQAATRHGVAIQGITRHRVDSTGPGGQRGEQPEHLGLVGYQLGQDPRQPDRLGTQVLPYQLHAGTGRVPLVEHSTGTAEPDIRPIDILQSQHRDTLNSRSDAPTDQAPSKIANSIRNTGQIPPKCSVVTG